MLMYNQCIMDNRFLEIAERYSSQLPNLREAFEEAASISPLYRVEWAKSQRKNIFRDGWFVNTPVAINGDTETVQQHVEHLKFLINEYFPQSYKSLASDYAEYHDDQEVIAHAVINGIKRDLNPRFNKKSYVISDDDKEIIEMAAVDLLFESDVRARDLWYSYKNADTDIASCFTGIDKVCVMWRCVDFVESGKYSYGDFQAYWDYWSVDTANKKLPELVRDIYVDKLLPRANKLAI